MKIVHFDEGDTLLMKKQHPCGSFSFRVVRGGSEVRVICAGCGRDITCAREKIEKNIKKVIPAPAEPV